VVQQILEQSPGDRFVAVDLLQGQAQDQGVGGRGGPQVEQDRGDLRRDLLWLVAVPVHRTQNDPEGHRRAAGDAGPAVDQERLRPGLVGEGKDAADVVDVRQDQCLLLLLVEALGADDIVADEAVDLAEAPHVDPRARRLADGDEVPEIRLVLGPGGQVGLGADREMALEAGEDHGRGLWRVRFRDSARWVGRTSRVILPLRRRRRIRPPRR